MALTYIILAEILLNSYYQSSTISLLLYLIIEPYY